MKKVVVFLADGFEEVEGLTVVDPVSYTHLDVYKRQISRGVK